MAWLKVVSNTSSNYSNAAEWAHSLPPPRADIDLALRVIGRRNAQQRTIEARWGPEAKDDAEWVFDRPCPVLPEPPANAPHPKGAVSAFKKKLDAWETLIATYLGYRPDLRGTNLQCANFSRLVLAGARLAGTRMEGADLREARMEGAALSGARMEGAHLREARMEGANLGGARMEGALLRGAQMEGADLGGARMDTSTSFSAATLRGAALRHVAVPPDVMSIEQIAAMFGDGSVTLPDDLASPKHWPEAELDDSEFYKEWRRWQDDPDGYEPPERRPPE